MPGVFECNLAIVGPLTQQPRRSIFESVILHHIGITLLLTVLGLRVVQQAIIKAVIVLTATLVSTAGESLNPAQFGIAHALEVRLDRTTFRAAPATCAAALISTQAHVGSKDIALRGAGLG